MREGDVAGDVMSVYLVNVSHLLMTVTALYCVNIKKKFFRFHSAVVVFFAVHINIYLSKFKYVMNEAAL